MKKVSVIIPVYNEEKYVGQCLESVINQTLEDIEIICVDDGSTDNTRTIIQKYAKVDARIKLLEQANLGGGAARNLGMSIASGEYLSFLDADDFFELDMLEKAYNKCKISDADICIYKVRFYHEATGAITEEEVGLREDLLPEKAIFSYKDMPQYIFNAFHNWPWNKMFKRAFVFENQLKFQEIMRTNDLYFVNKALISANKIVTINERLVNYRVRISGNCQSTNDKNPLDFYKAFLKLKNYLDKENIYEAVRNSFINHAIDGCINNLLTQEFKYSHESLFDSLKRNIFVDLDIANVKETEVYEWYYNAYSEYLDIKENDYKDYLMHRGSRLKQENQQLKFDIYNGMKEAAENTERAVRENYENSTTYKVGKLIMAMPIKIKRILKRDGN